jgi:hypothetical protein
LIQLHVDEEKTSVENPMKEWKEEDAPFVKVATIRIPSQKFDFDERKRLDESMLFTPWHTLPEHEPLGSVNLARKKIYQELAKARREQIQKSVGKIPSEAPLYGNPTTDAPPPTPPSN